MKYTGGWITEMNGYARVDNWLWDYVMPKARPNTFKAVNAVLRMTVGWNREWQCMSFDDFQELTGIASRGTMTRAIDDALSEGFIQRRKDGRGHAYSLKIIPVPSPKIVPEGAEPVSKPYSDQYENETDGSSDQYENETATGLKTVLEDEDTLYKQQTKDKGEPPQTPPEPDLEPSLPGMPADLRLPVDVDFPECLDSPDFLEKWWKYEHHRDGMGRPMSTTQRQTQLDKAAHVGMENAIWVIDQSLEKGWQGLIWDRLAERNGARASPANGAEPEPKGFAAIRAMQQEWDDDE